MSKSQPLPPKEQTLFKRVLKCYEQKQYKNGLKFAKQILSNPKQSEHGETLAMKGLMLNAMGKREEGFDHVRRGLKSDIKSHVCWHVYGLLQRSEKKFDEAIKCYRNALKLEPENIQIMRDLSLLQVQMRDLEGYRETRYQLLQQRPAQRQSWIGYAMSYHLLKEYSMALSITEQFRESQMETMRYEKSELLLYENMLLVESGRLQAAFDHLEKFESQIVDKVSYLETKGDLLISLGRNNEATLVYKQLLERNPENVMYFKRLEEAHKPKTVDDQLAIYCDIFDRFSYVSVARRLPLTFLTGEKFQSFLDAYMRRMLTKGAAPLFTLLKCLYSDLEKVQVIEQTALGYLESLHSCMKFDPTDSEESIQPPTTELWTLHLLAQHCCYLDQSERALEFIDRALDHTPTLIELYMVKAKIYKKAGDCRKAAECLNDGRMLDTADRYINCKCAKYMLQSDQVERAEELCSMFTREGASASDTLNEMQCIWFERESALSYRRQGSWGKALQKCHEIERHFMEIFDDQFDFHTYCMRKMTLRAYVELLQVEDKLRSHPFYFQAAKLAIEIYIRLYDQPLVRQNKEADKLGEMSEQERKKMLSKQRKAQKKAAQKQQQLQSGQDKDTGKRDTKERDSKQTDNEKKETGKDLLLVPEELESTKQPLEEALKFLKPLQTLASSRVETHLLAYQIFCRKRKFLLMLQSVKRAAAIDRNHHELHEHIVDLMLAVASAEGLSRPVSAILHSTLPALLDAPNVEEFNRQFLHNNAKSLPHLLSGCKVLYKLKPENRDEAIRLVTDLSDELTDRNVKWCSAVLESLQGGNFGNIPEVAEQYKQDCHKLFRFATAFAPPKVETEDKEDPNSDASHTEAAALNASKPSGKNDTVDPPENEGLQQ